MSHERVSTSQLLIEETRKKATCCSQKGEMSQQHVTVQLRPTTDINTKGVPLGTAQRGYVLIDSIRVGRGPHRGR